MLIIGVDYRIVFATLVRYPQKLSNVAIPNVVGDELLTSLGGSFRCLIPIIHQAYTRRVVLSGEGENWTSTVIVPDGLHV